MKNTFTIFIGCLVALVLLVYMFAYQVRYDEFAVITRFDEVTDASVREKPGLGFMIPLVNKVTKYSRKVQVLESQLEQQQTRDRRAVIIRTYMAWRISDPRAFYESRFRTVRDAEEQLRALQREIGSIISRYDFNQLVNTDENKLMISQIEQEAQAQLTQQLNSHGYGITVDEVGIRRIVLPEDVTEQVFSTMRKTRERLAAKARSEGDAEAAAILAEAESAKKRILAFAESAATDIRARGDAEAIQHYAAFSQSPEYIDFAIFLRKVEALEKMLAHNTTFVLDAGSLGLLDMLNQQPGESRN
jgi:membrane protease subunit HflC